MNLADSVMHNTMILIPTQFDFDSRDHQQSPENKYSTSVPKGVSKLLTTTWYKSSLLPSIPRC